MRSRSRSGLAGALVAVVLAGCAGGPAVTPVPTPAPASPSLIAATPAITPVPGPATPATISAGAAALDGYRSYRFTQTLVEPAGVLRGVVVNADPHRVRMESLVDGVVASTTIGIGDTSWLSFSGSNYVKQPDMGHGADTWQNPVSSDVESLIDRLATVEDIGVEDRSGVPARHLRGTASLGETSGLGLDGLPTDMDYGFVGRIDAWMATDDGHLVALRADGEQISPSFGGSGDEEPPPTSRPYVVDLSVEGIDEPANVVEEPPVLAATSQPSGDPAAIALVEGIGDGMRRLDAYVIEATTNASGMNMRVTLTVVNRPVPAAMSVTETGVPDFPGLSILVIGDKAWGRSGEDAWAGGKGKDGPTCGTSGQSLSLMKPCTFELMTAFASHYAATAATFTIIATDEVVDGTPCTHLRSEAGMTSGEMTLPGTTDIWIANDGGYLVKDTFTGVAITTSSRTTRVNDPGIKLEPPTH
jgi:hypothetical protein